MAERYHAGQKYGPFPYHYHLLQVYMIARLHLEELAEELRERALVVALLHDILEDTSCPQSEILESFGPQALESVKRLTNTYGRGSAIYYARIAEDPVASFVKCCDRIANIREALLFNVTDKLELYKKEKAAISGILKSERLRLEIAALLDQ